MKTKAEIRKQILLKRELLSLKEVQDKSTVICKKIISSPVYNSAKVIYLYSAVKNEVDVSFIMRDAQKKDKIVAFPKVEGKKITFYSVTSDKQFQRGAFSILEPCSGITAPKADLIIVPGVAFDARGLRLGYGGGFYDRYLSKCDACCIGVAYDFQILKQIPQEKHDVILDKIISD